MDTIGRKKNESREIVAPKKDDTHELVSVKNDEKELSIAGEKDLAIVASEKGRPVLPSADGKDLELVETHEAKVIMPPNVNFFREELMKDIAAAQNVAKEDEAKPSQAAPLVVESQEVKKEVPEIVEVKSEKPVSPPEAKTEALIVNDSSNSNDKSQPIDGLNIVKAARTGAEMGIKVDQAQSRQMDFENTGEVIQKPGAEGGAAIVIEGTFTPEQLRAKKIKKLLNLTITLVVIALVAVAGYYFAWPMLRDFMKSF